MAQGRTPSTSRLPSTRESRPALIGLAILLIVGGALASGYLALQAGNRASFVMVERGVAPGSQITADDLGRVSLPEGFSGGIPEADKSKVVGSSAKVTLLQGTVLTPAMISDETGLKAGQAQLPITVDSSPFMAGLAPGSPLALNIGTDTGSGTTRISVYAELASVDTSNGRGGITGGGSSSTTSLVVTISSSCLSVVSQAVNDQSLKAALIGASDDVAKTCEG